MCVGYLIPLLHIMELCHKILLLHIMQFAIYFILIFGTGLKNPSLTFLGQRAARPSQVTVLTACPWTKMRKVKFFSETGRYQESLG